MSNERHACRRPGCLNTSAAPEAAGWAFADKDMVPAQHPDWTGWWCPRCVRAQRLFQVVILE